jgi:hypothetical protein
VRPVVAPGITGKLRDVRVRSIGPDLCYEATGRPDSLHRPASDAPGISGTGIAVWDATIWQRDPDGAWRIAVDISTPLPPSG